MFLLFILNSIEYDVQSVGVRMEKGSVDKSEGTW